MADAPKTRTRRTSSPKAEQTAQEQTDAQKRAAEKEAEAQAKAAQREAEKAERDAKKAEEKAEREAKRAAEKAERDAKREQEKAEKEKERAEAKAAKEAEASKEREALIEAGSLIVDGETEHRVVEPKKDTVAQRANEVIEELMERGRETPIAGKYFADKHGGGTVQWVAFWGMLRVLGLVQVYRFSTGNRGESGLSYRWIGD